MSEVSNVVILAAGDFPRRGGRAWKVLSAAFHDVLTEFGARWSIVFRNAGAVAKGLRAVCTDAMEETPGLDVVFKD